MNNSTKSERIDAAISSIESGDCKDYSEAAGKFGCDRTSVSKRIRKITQNKVDSNSLHRQCLTNTQEASLIARINQLTDRGLPPTSAMVRNLAEEIRGRSVGKNWVGQFVKRHKKELVSLYLRNIDNLRIGAEYRPMIEEFYQLLSKTIEKHHITAENMWNFDEKGFLIGFSRTLKRIMTRTAYKSNRITKAQHDGSQEFISCLACISATGKTIPPVLIYAGTAGDLYSSWVQDVTPKDQVFFTVSENGWSLKEIGLSWLQQVFERFTKPSRATTKRLLILDGHASHINMEFVQWADAHHVILLILPPHTTHRLQPLDVGCFQPLSTAYSNGINDFLTSSNAAVSMSKALFYSIFKVAWEQAFTSEVIQRAWEKSGIFPTAPNVVLDAITRLDYNGIVPDMLRTPQTSTEIRQFQKSYQQEPTTTKRKKLFSWQLKVTAENSILKHQVQGLYSAVELQKKKNKRARRLNLDGTKAGGPVCYSPAKVAAACLYQDGIEAQEALQIEEKASRLRQRAANKELKESKDASAQLQKELQAQIPVAPKLSKGKANTTALKAKPPLSTKLPTPKEAKASIPVAKPPKKAPDKVTVEPEQENRGPSREAGKRTIALPTRFRS